MFSTDSILARVISLQYPNGLQCPKCGAAIGSEIVNASGQIRCPKCWRWSSLLDGSIMENGHLPLKQWDRLFRGIAETRNLSTAIKAINEVDSAPTRCRCLHKLSLLLEITCPMLSGTVDIDIVDFPPATYLLLPQQNPDSILALLMAENYPEGKFIVRLVPQRNAEVICSAIASHVMPGTIVKTGCWSVFEGLKEKGLKVEMAIPIPRLYDVMATVMPLFPTCQNGLARFVKWLGDGWTNLPFETMQLYLPFFNIHSAMNFENPEIAYDFLLKAALTTSNEQLQRIR